MKLYGYWRSGTSYRTRLGLALKGIEVEHIPVDLTTGAQKSPEYMADNPQGLVPTLVLDDGTAIAQSGAILEYLDEKFPARPLLPAGVKARAHVRQICQIVGCDIHPLNNLRILKHLKNEFDQPQSGVDDWAGRWIAEGFDAFEALLGADQGRGAFSFGGRPGMAECYLIPQIYSARRFNVDVARWPLILGVEEATLALPEVAAALPENQADAKPS
ncbi:maleylacetoacetate isomerase [Parvularcula marina]|uniref:Maleylacetoacetate isomerase n=1 Tax=Parvularcula marina TaxID=2292771 RepID=A0A371RFL6_9PROT|nr:maleylacetoacetate isomerase [Parvularcula marina]RFB04249.1 maleylacetoacetate isomerase [Parvularcula marina]